MLAELLLAAQAAVATADVNRVVVGSKQFTESRLLGEMLTILLETHTDLEVEHRAWLGGTMVCFEALKSGEIDVYPEYTGTGWSIVLKEPGKTADPLRAFLRVESRFRELYDLEWLSPFGFNNSYALAMDAARAEMLGIHSISDLLPHAGELTAGFSVEFMGREDGYPGLTAHYGLEFSDAKSMEHGLAYAAIERGALDVVDAYTTDGELLRYDLRVLDDDGGFFPPYNAAPVVRGELLRGAPEVRAALDTLAFRISDDEMRALNYAVEVEQRAFGTVAREFLASRELLDTPGNEAALVEQSVTGELAIGKLLFEHVRLTAIAVLLAALIAIPLGIAITRNRAAERLSLGAASAVQTIPSLALLALMIAIPGLGLSVRSAIVALTLYAILPILRNTFAGLRAVDPDLVDAARGMGLTEWQILCRIQLPLATRTIMAGMRTATVLTVGFATLAAFISAGGLGTAILAGLYLNDVGLILKGALPAAALALFADGALGLLEKALTPRGTG